LRQNAIWYAIPGISIPFESIGGFAFAKAFDLFGIAHLAKDLFNHDTTYIRALSLDIRNTKFSELSVDRRFDNAGLGSPDRARMAVAFFELLICRDNGAKKTIKPRKNIVFCFMPLL